MRLPDQGLITCLKNGGSAIIVSHLAPFLSGKKKRYHAIVSQNGEDCQWYSFGTSVHFTELLTLQFLVLHIFHILLLTNAQKWNFIGSMEQDMIWNSISLCKNLFCLFVVYGLHEIGKTPLFRVSFSYWIRGTNSSFVVDNVLTCDWYAFCDNTIEFSINVFTEYTKFNKLRQNLKVVWLPETHNIWQQVHS